jgi:hypothetical protein
MPHLMHVSREYELVAQVANGNVVEGHYWLEMTGARHPACPRASTVRVWNLFSLVMLLVCSTGKVKLGIQGGWIFGRNKFILGNGSPFENKSLDVC